jgi:hypothetical protein
MLRISIDPSSSTNFLKTPLIRVATKAVQAPRYISWQARKSFLLILNYNSSLFVRGLHQNSSIWHPHVASHVHSSERACFQACCYHVERNGIVPKPNMIHESCKRVELGRARPCHWEYLENGEAVGVDSGDLLVVFACSNRRFRCSTADSRSCRADFDHC